MTMRHELPTHLDVQDRAFFGLTARQLGLLLGGAGAGYGLWEAWPGLPVAVRAALAAACAVAAIALALVRPAERALEDWAFVAVRFLAMPRATVWRAGQVDPSVWRARERAWRALPLRRRWEDTP